MAVMSDQTRALEVSRVIDASAHSIFDFLSKPANHVALDTSGMIRGSADDGAVTGVGTVFVMDMNADNQVENHVVAYEPDRTIGWAPAEPGHEPAGHTWIWRLEPLAHDRTLVTQTYDWSAFTHLHVIDRLPVVNQEQMQASLDLLADALAR
jgi:uncharacterized protein YndB with AHSA1/START domain